MTDMFVLLQLPNAGDELQAIKKGVMELADLVVINKADIDPDAATRARAQINSSLRLLGLVGGHHHGHEPHARMPQLWHGVPRSFRSVPCRPKGVDRFWAAVCEFWALGQANGRSRRREHQALAWMWDASTPDSSWRFAKTRGARAPA